MISQIVVVAVIAVGVVLAVTFVSLLLDALLRVDMGVRAMDACRIKHLRSSENDEVVIVFLPGLLASSTMLSSRILDVWSRYGQVWGVDYSPPRFMPEHIAGLVADELARHCAAEPNTQRIVLIGSSLGGLLVYDIQQQLAGSRFVKAEVGVVVVDAPTGREDFQSPLNWTSQVVRVLPFGPIWNHLSSWAMEQLFIPPKEGEINVNVDRDWLAEQVAGARSFPLSFWRDQVMFILKHGAPKPESIDVSLIYIRSTEDDDTVRYEASEAWRRAMSSKSPRSFMLDAEGAKHAAYAQNPSAYEKVFPRAFGLLGL